MKHGVACAAFFVAFAFACSDAGAKPTMETVYKASLHIHDFGAVDISRDGTAVTWQASYSAMQGMNDTRRRTALFLRRGEGPTVRLTAGNASQYSDEENPVWSSDGSRIAFLSDARSPGQLQIFVANADGSKPKPVARLAGNVQSLRWIPGGTMLSILYIHSAHRSAGALAPGARDVGVVGSVVDEQRLATVSLATGAVTEITPASDYIYEYDWSPDGTTAALTYAPGNGDNNWWIAKLATIGASGGAMRDLLAPPYQINDPAWSPDGKRIAIIGGIMSDFGSVGGDVYLIDPTSGAAKDVAPQMSVSAASLHWTGPSQIDMTANDNGSVHLVRLNVQNGSLSTIVGGEERIADVAVARNNGNIALVRSSFTSPPDLWTGPAQHLRRITDDNRDVPKLYGKAVSLSWKSDGYTVQGWLVYPLDYRASQTYPMITIVHGGPSAQTTPRYGDRTLCALSSQGYFVLYPNPRGSFGHGEAFAAANVKDFGYGDWRDDLAGVDAAIKAAPIDAARLGLWGWSYGGYMGMWAETQTTRFRAIVAGAGIVNWQSYYGQNKIDQWMIPFFGASVYDDPAVYAKSSPITFIKQSKTPVLILQGERDEEVPAPQAFEFWHAMKTLGVPTKLVVYADEGHGPRRPANQIDILNQTIDWYAKYL
ncbi:MAG: S9 family peptidase [Candidatus Eremiobacteraeota bacterium]|nr:S9 family peptidase [Candidatus Eremiobacteraeota bacterium]